MSSVTCKSPQRAETLRQQVSRGRMSVTLSAGCVHLAHKVEQQTHPGPVSEKRLNKLRLWTPSWFFPRWKSLQSLDSWSEVLASTWSRFTLSCTHAPRLQNINGGPVLTLAMEKKMNEINCLLTASAKGFSSKYFPFFKKLNRTVVRSFGI